MSTALGQSPPGLGRLGVSVTTSHEARLLGATDDEQAGYALREGRVTQDADFLRINAAGQPHAGIAYCEKDTKSVREILDGLILIWEVLETDEMVGRVEFI